MYIPLWLIVCHFTGTVICTACIVAYFTYKETQETIGGYTKRSKWFDSVSLCYFAGCLCCVWELVLPAWAIIFCLDWYEEYKYQKGKYKEQK